MCFFRSSYDEIRRNSEENRRLADAIEKQNRVIEEMQRQNRNTAYSFQESQKINNSFREEALKKQKQDETEKRNLLEKIEKTNIEQERMKRAFEESRKSKEESERIRSEELKIQMKKLSEEKKKLEDEKSDMEKQNKLSEQSSLQIKEKIKDYSELLKSRIREGGNFDLIENSLARLDKEVMNMKEISISKPELFDIIAIGRIINGIYENAADAFYQNGYYQKAVELYEKIKDNLLQGEKFSDKLLFKYSLALFGVSRYQDVISTLDMIESLDDSIKQSEADMILFKSRLYIKDFSIVKSTKQIIEKYSKNKAVLNEFICVFNEHIGFFNDENVLNAYFSLLLRYKPKFEAEKVLKGTSDGYKYKNFYLGTNKLEKGDYENASKLLSGYKNNFFAQLLNLKSRRMSKKLDNSDFKFINEAKNILLESLKEKELQKRIDLVKNNDELLFINPENLQDYFYIYCQIFQARAEFLFSGNDIDALYSEMLELFEITNNDFSITSSLKSQIASYYRFLKNNGAEEKANKILSFLEEQSSSVELQILMDDNLVPEKTVEELYESDGVNFKGIVNNEFFGYYAKNRLSGEKHVILETNPENLNSDAFIRRKEAVEKDKLLGDKYTNFARIYAYEVTGEFTKIVYGDFEYNLKNYFNNSDPLNRSNIKEKLDFAVQLVGIFKSMENEEIIMSSLNPDRILISRDKKLYLRDIYFEDSFRSESQSSVRSQRYISKALYRSPEDKNKRSAKSNYYVLGLLLYELFAGKYLFSGVVDYDTINFLHGEKPVSKKKAVSLMKYWIVTDPNDTETVVSKDSLKDNSPMISGEIINEINKMISSDITKRPESLNKILNELKSVDPEKSAQDVTEKVISAVVASEFLNNLKIKKVYVNDEYMSESLLKNINNTEIYSSKELGEIFLRKFPTCLKGYCELGENREMAVFTGDANYLVTNIVGNKYKISNLDKEIKVLPIDEIKHNDHASVSAPAKEELLKLANELIQKADEDDSEYIFSTLNHLQDYKKGSDPYKEDVEYRKSAEKIAKKYGILFDRSKDFLDITNQIMNKINSGV